MYYIGVRDGKKEKEGKINLSSFVSAPQYTWPLSMCIQNLKTLALKEDEKFVTENLFGDKEKLRNKGNDHNTTSHIQHLYQISKSYMQ